MGRCMGPIPMVVDVASVCMQVDLKPQALSSVWATMSPKNTDMDRVSGQTGKTRAWRKNLFRGIHLGKAAMSWLRRIKRVCSNKPGHSTQTTGSARQN